MLEMHNQKILDKEKEINDWHIRQKGGKIMKELIKIVPKKLFIYSIIFNTLYSIAEYGETFALSHFGTSPLTLDKLIKLAICIVITHIIMLISGKVASYIDNINNQKTQTQITIFLTNY